jgi:hypothetical protein
MWLRVWSCSHCDNAAKCNIWIISVTIFSVSGTVSFFAFCGLKCEVWFRWNVFSVENKIHKACATTPRNFVCFRFLSEQTKGCYVIIQYSRAEWNVDRFLPVGRETNVGRPPMCMFVFINSLFSKIVYVWAYLNSELKIIKFRVNVRKLCFLRILRNKLNS